jgi:hypothetical protein
VFAGLECLKCNLTVLADPSTHHYQVDFFVREECLKCAIMPRLRVVYGAVGSGNDRLRGWGRPLKKGVYFDIRDCLDKREME